MKNICNLFRPIDKTNGNFLLFSQYVEDVSRSVVDSAYRVRPSQFVCLDFNQTIQNKAKSFTHTYVGEDTTKYIPAYFQNFFENGISALKDAGTEITPLNFSIGFIEKLVSLTANGTTLGLQNYVKYVGNIDLESWEDGFADIVLDISSGAHPAIVKVATQVGGVQTADYTYPENPIFISIDDFKVQCCAKRTYNNVQGTNGYYIHGWVNDNTLPISGRVQNQSDIGVGAGDGHPWSDNSPVFNQLIQTIPDINSNSFAFNTIIVFYDILDDTNNPIYTGIPMGIYFTGAGEADGIGNDVTIYSSSVDAYGAGSGWALRICTKFSPTPYGNLQVEEVALESKSITKSISTLLSATAEAVKAVNNFASKSISELQSIKDITATFKNSRTNVPYPKEVNGVQYWFVNGRNTEIPCTVEVPVQS